MVETNPERSDVTVLRVSATQAASDLGNPRVANMVMLGAYLEHTRALNPESVFSALEDRRMRPELVKLNRLALDAGRSLATCA